MIEEVNDNWNTGNLEYPYGRGVNLSMEVDDIDLLYEKVKDMSYSIFRKIQVASYQVGDIEYLEQQ